MRYRLSVDCTHGDIDFMLCIDPVEGIDCGACEPACPVTDIVAEEDVLEAVHMQKTASRQVQLDSERFE